MIAKIVDRFENKFNTMLNENKNFESIETLLMSYIIDDLLNGIKKEEKDAAAAAAAITSSDVLFGGNPPTHLLFREASSEETLFGGTPPREMFEEYVPNIKTTVTFDTTPPTSNRRVRMETPRKPSNDRVVTRRSSAAKRKLFK